MLWKGVFLLKLITKTLIFCVCLYGFFWFAKNLDYISVFTKTSDSLKYEFSDENIQNMIFSVKQALK